MASSYSYLETREGESTRQMFFKGMRKRAWTVVALMRVQKMTPEQIASSHGVPVPAVYEAIEWCDANRELIEREDREELIAASTWRFG